MNECSAYVGLDVPKDTIAVAVALPGRGEPVYRGEVRNQRKSVLCLIRALSPAGEVVSFTSKRTTPPSCNIRLTDFPLLRVAACPVALGGLTLIP